MGEKKLGKHIYEWKKFRAERFQTNQFLRLLEVWATDTSRQFTACLSFELAAVISALNPTPLHFPVWFTEAGRLSLIFRSSLFTVRGSRSPCICEIAQKPGERLGFLSHTVRQLSQTLGNGAQFIFTVNFPTNSREIFYFFYFEQNNII